MWYAFCGGNKARLKPPIKYFFRTAGYLKAMPSNIRPRISAQVATQPVRRSITERPSDTIDLKALPIDAVSLNRLDNETSLKGWRGGDMAKALSRGVEIASPAFGPMGGVLKLATSRHGLQAWLNGREVPVTRIPQNGSRNAANRVELPNKTSAFIEEDQHSLFFFSLAKAGAPTVEFCFTSKGKPTFTEISRDRDMIRTTPAGLQAEAWLSLSGSAEYLEGRGLTAKAWATPNDWRERTLRRQDVTGLVGSANSLCKAVQDAYLSRY